MNVCGWKGLEKKSIENRKLDLTQGLTYQQISLALSKPIPSGWQTAICADVCYPAGLDSVLFSLNVNDTMHLSLDFLTDFNPPDLDDLANGV